MITKHGDTRVVKKVEELDDSSFRVIFTIDLSAIKSEVYLASCLTDKRYRIDNEINHDISFSDSNADLIFTVIMSDITIRSDFNLVEAKVKKSINLARRETATPLKADLSWIDPSKTFHVR